VTPCIYSIKIIPSISRFLENLPQKKQHDDFILKKVTTQTYRHR